MDNFTILKLIILLMLEGSYNHVLSCSKVYMKVFRKFNLSILWIFFKKFFKKLNMAYHTRFIKFIVYKSIQKILYLSPQLTTKKRLFDLK